MVFDVPTALGCASATPAAKRRLPSVAKVTKTSAFSKAKEAALLRIRLMFREIGEIRDENGASKASHVSTH
jgi:hypothetical protein